MDIATQMARKYRIRNAFIAWRLRLAYLYQNLMNWEKAVKFRNQAICKKALAKWKSWNAKKNHLDRRLDDARKWYARRCLRHVCRYNIVIISIELECLVHVRGIQTSKEEQNYRNCSATQAQINYMFVMIIA